MKSRLRFCDSFPAPVYYVNTNRAVEGAERLVGHGHLPLADGLAGAEVVVGDGEEAGGLDGGADAGNGQVGGL